jgi:riboflavin kinase/FMN adenylyltransferase
VQVIRNSTACPRPSEGSAVTIGAYDGVHLGHRAVIGEVRRLANERELSTAVVTFDRHPATVVRPESAPRLLTDLDQKLELLDSTGVDYCHVVHFDAERATETAEDFVHRVLVDCLNTRVVVVGADFHFGHHRRGNVALLTEMGKELGFDVLGLDLVGADGQAAPAGSQVSSTAIRSALSAGDLATANLRLGRPHQVRGVVKLGDQRGRQLGFPTANVAVPEDVQLPADGIYAGWFTRADGSVHRTAISLGRRPTFYVDQRESLLEAHLLDFDGDLYGESVRVAFVEHIRGEIRFDSVDDLIAQMARDCDEAKRILER